MENMDLLTSEQFLRRVLVESDQLSVLPPGELAIEGSRVSDLLSAYGSPLFVMSDTTLRQNVRRIRNAFESEWQAPVNIMYALKCNPNFAVRAVMHEEGAGGDCFGLGELEATFAGGADVDKIALNGSNKSDTVINRAIDLGVYINIDSEAEAVQIERLAARKQKEVRVNIRLKVIPEEYRNYSSDLINFSGDFREELRRLKWGVNEQTAVRMINNWASYPHLTLTGYHTHLGRLSQKLEDRVSYDREFGLVISRIFLETGFEPNLIDIGGGWPRDRDPESGSQELNPYSIEEYAKGTCRALRNSFMEAQIPLPELWLEPGRYIAGNAGTLLTTIESIKEEGNFKWVYVDASTNIMPLIGAVVEGTYNCVVSATKMWEQIKDKADVVGPLCIPSVLHADCPLPPVTKGDIIAILDAGMYAESDSNQLNWIPRPATVMVKDNLVGLVRQAETLESIFSTQRLPEWLQETTEFCSMYRNRVLKSSQTHG